MNKVFCRKRLLFSLIFTGYLILFNTACGLDTFYELYAPDKVNHQPDWESGTEADFYFDFYTKYNDNPNIRFLGTEVYYKIYKNSSRLKTEKDDLISIANKDNSSNAAEKLTVTYKFQSLRGAGYDNKAVLIPTSATKINDDDTDVYYDKDVRIEIRLSDYKGVYYAKILADGYHIYTNDEYDDSDNPSSYIIPVRNIPKKLSFTLSNNNLPESGDDDVNMSGASSDNYWYVSMFAVAVGQDSNYSRVYSNILYLGSVRLTVN